MKWKKAKLKTSCSKIGSGSTPRGGSQVYIDTGTSFIRSQNVYNLRFDPDGLAFITEEAAQRLAGVTVQSKDVLLNITGDSVARTCLVPESVLPARVNQHVAIIRPIESVLNAKFLCYYLATPHMQQVMLGLAVGKGASRNAITKEMIGQFEVPCPPLDIQSRIAKVLSSYDGLIENNRRQIKLLEEAAQRLYKEWFIDLRFPGWETTPIVDGLPEGWMTTTLQKSCVVVKDAVNPVSVEVDAPYIGLEHMPRKDICLSNWGNASQVTSGKYRIKSDDILFGKIRPYFHKVGFVLANGVSSTDIFVFRAAPRMWALVLMCVSSDAFVNYAYQTCKEGAKMPRADWNAIKDYEIVVADQATMKVFSGVIWNITRLIKTLAMQTRNLAQARDLLLLTLFD